MPDSIKDARSAIVEERERIRSEVRELEAKLVELDAAVASLDRLVDDRAPARPARGGRPSAASSNGATSQPRQGRTQPSMVSLIESFIEEQGRKSAHADDVLNYLQSIDRAPGGKNPKATVQTTLGQLQKRGRIKNIGRNRWRADRTRRSTRSRREEATA